MATTTRVSAGARSMPRLFMGPIASALLVEPGHLDGLENLLVRLCWIVVEPRQGLDPLPQIGEAQIHHVGVGVLLLELGGDIVDIGPAHPTSRPSDCAWPRAGRPSNRPAPR